MFQGTRAFFPSSPTYFPCQLTITQLEYFFFFFNETDGAHLPGAPLAQGCLSHCSVPAPRSRLGAGARFPPIPAAARTYLLRVSVAAWSEKAGLKRYHCSLPRFLKWLISPCKNKYLNICYQPVPPGLLYHPAKSRFYSSFTEALGTSRYFWF